MPQRLVQRQPQGLQRAAACGVGKQTQERAEYRRTVGSFGEGTEHSRGAGTDPDRALTGPLVKRTARPRGQRHRCLFGPGADAYPLHEPERESLVLEVPMLVKLLRSAIWPSPETLHFEALSSCVWHPGVRTKRLFSRRGIAGH